MSTIAACFMTLLRDRLRVLQPSVEQWHFRVRCRSYSSLRHNQTTSSNQVKNFADHGQSVCEAPFGPQRKRCQRELTSGAHVRSVERAYIYKLHIAAQSE